MNVIITEGLIRHLKAKFPSEVSRKKDLTLADIHRQQGSLLVLDYLESLYKNQNPTEELLHVFNPKST